MKAAPPSMEVRSLAAPATANTDSGRVVLAAYPLRSVAVATTEYTPAAVGVPVMVPVTASSDSPDGNPVADHT